MASPSAEFADYVREVQSGWISGDPEAIERLARAERSAIGFGFRDAAARDHRTIGVAGFQAGFSQFLAGMDYYRFEFDELETAVDGEIGLAWGFFTEDFKVKGREPEKARVRFSLVAMREVDGWRSLLSHRDIQPFDADGRYPAELTTTTS